MSSIITVSNLSKAYRIGMQADRADSLVGMLQDSIAAPFRNWRKMRQPTGESSDPVEELHWALRDVSFEVKEGEVLGVIGHNGAGKSTLLKILSRITEPTGGEVRIRGRIASLLEVGTGFHPELTGRENVFLNGTILGMTKKEIDKKFDEIVAFSGVEKFLDSPVKRYSSGMKVRLAFSVAAHLEPEILIVDEVLSVGDAEFQKRCIGKIREVSQGGRTVVFVSHDLAAVQNLCSRSMLMLSGRCQQIGTPVDIISEYLSRNAHCSDFTVNLRDHPRRTKSSRVVMQEVFVLRDGVPSSRSIGMNEGLRLGVKFRHTLDPFFPVLGIVVKSNMGASIFGINNRFIDNSSYTIEANEGVVVCDMGNVPLLPGSYDIDLYFGDRHSDLDIIERAIDFEIVAMDYYGTGKLPPKSAGPVRWTGHWTLI
jgi:lipopolysaccharide transport system ATP-binding protein